jgi:YfiH family protein
LVAFHGAPPTYLTYTALRALGVPHAFTTRHHGSFRGAGPAVEALGVAAGTLRFARQVHGGRCLVVDGAGPGLVGTGDALLTRTPGQPLAVFTADCLGVIVIDPDRRVLAVAHAGWRGTVAGLMAEVVRHLVGLGASRPEHLHAVIGPAIGPCCYEVDEPVVAPLRSAFPEAWARWARPIAPGKWLLDLWQANTDQLIAAGVRPDAVQNARLCTRCRGDLFFSYRREGPGSRLATLATL